MSGDSLLRVFVSSTSEDLKDYRAVARQIIGNLRWEPVMMEDFGASPTATVAACEQELEKCDLVLLILAFRKGWVPSVDQGGNDCDSITAIELAHARKRGIPVLSMMANTDWPMKLIERDDAARKWVEEFRKNLNLPAEHFGPEDTQGSDEKRLPSFRELVRKVLLGHKERLLAQQQRDVEPQARNIDYSASARDIVLEARSVPVIGHGVYADGPLNSHALAKALVEQGDDTRDSLATVAELRERQLLTRAGFLDELNKIISRQSHEAKLPLVFRMLLDMPKLPPLVVLTTYDQLFEDALVAQGLRHHVVVTHIVRSADGEHDGKILVLRRGQEPIITSADKVDVGADECIVYRPLGSPLLHAQTNPSWEIDTVVITETDHLTFLSRLENEHMTVPTRFNNWLRRKPLLFLGYGLDLWNYRLFMHVFRVIGERKADAPVLAVRKPIPGMEAASWERLGAKLVHLDANDFARQVMAASAQA